MLGPYSCAVVGWALLILQINSFQAKERDQVGFFQLYNTCSFEYNMMIQEPEKIKVKSKRPEGILK